MISSICRAVGPTAACVFNELHSYSSLPDGARPSIAKVATALGCSRSTVQRSIRQLVDAGYLTVEHRYDAETGQLPSRYNFPKSPAGHSRPTPQVIHELPPSHLCPTPIAETPYESTKEGYKNKRGIVAELKIKTPDPIQGKKDQGKRPTTSGPGAHNPETAAKAARIVEVFKDYRESKDCLKPRTTAGWTKSALVLLQRRSGNVDEVIRVLKYALAEPFWSPQLKDLYHFAERYDQFRLMAQENKSSTAFSQREIEDIESRFFDLRDLRKMASL